jgi:HlyD family secretion protein
MFVKPNIRRILLLVGLLLLLLAGGIFFTFKYWQSSQSTLPKGVITTPVTRGTIVTRVGSTGKVRPNQLVELNWQTTGNVGLINIKTNDQVKAGDVLMELDVTSFQPSILEAMESLPAAQRTLDLLDVSDLKRTQSKEDLAKAEIEYKNAKDARELKNQRNSSETSLLKAEATYLQAKANLDSVETYFSFLQDKPEDDLARAQATAQLSLARKNYDWAVWNYQYAKDKPLPEDIRIADANLKVAESKLADAQREWEKVKNNPDPDDVVSARSNVEALKAQINLAKIIAPINGTVLDSKLLVGDVVKTGQKALTLIDRSHLFLDISISEVDINQVRLGEEVNFSLDAIPEKTFEGVVSEISKVGIDDQGIIYYTVTCEINDFDSAIKPGMTAAAFIQVEKAENVIKIPNDALHFADKKYSVFVIRENKVEQILVELGMISDTFSEMKSGNLREGDSLVTNPRSVLSQVSGK